MTLAAVRCGRRFSGGWRYSGGIGVFGGESGHGIGRGDDMTKVIVVNGPNLGRLGVREPDVYGRQDLEALRDDCAKWGADLGLEVEVRQSDDEAEVIGWMHQAVDDKTPVVMNPAAFTHYSYGLSDAAHMVTDAGLPLMEVHISNPSARDQFRKHSVISPVATGTITGLGFFGYRLALEAVAHSLEV
jgi:3-dehydroquinate dehydratase II